MPARFLLILLLLLPVALTPRVQAVPAQGPERQSCCVLCTCGDMCLCIIDEPAERPAPEPYAPTRGPELTAVAAKSTLNACRSEPSRPLLFAPVRDERAGLCSLPVLARLCVWRT